MKWCRRRKTKARGYKLSPPYDNVFIGCDPNDGMTRKVADSFDVYVNVADSPCNTFEPSYPGQVMRWYPVNEMGRWNLSYLYWLKKVMDFHHDRGDRIYLHCHAGAYRSPSAALLWLQSRGLTPTQARKIVRERGPTIYKIWENHGNVPDLKDKLFKSMRKHPTWGLSGNLNEACGHVFKEHEVASGHTRTYNLLHHYFFFYFKPKAWIRENWHDFKNWAFKRYGYYRQGWGTYYYVRKYFWVKPRNAEPKNLEESIVTFKKWSPSKRTFVKIRKKR